MAKQYENASPDVAQRLRKLLEAFHPELGTLNGQYVSVSFCVLFVFSEEKGQVLEHQGYPAAAVTKITSTKERAAGLADVLIVIDRFVYSGLPAASKDALLDHELYHVERVFDENEKPKFDANGRPKLELRKHDRQFGWFDEIAQRHGPASFEMRQAKEILAATGQLYFDFGPRDRVEAA